MNKIDKIYGNIIKWNMAPDEIMTSTNKIINKSKMISDEMANMKTNNTNEINKFLSLLSNDLNEFNIFHTLCGFLQYVSPNEKVRKASCMADLLLSKYVNDFNFREDIYTKLTSIKNFVLNKDDIQFIDKLILNFQRNGIDLDNNKRELLLKINHEISKLENAILKCINDNENNYIKLNVNEVKGIPLNILAAYEKTSDQIDTFKIQFNRVNYNLFMKYIDNANIRKLIESTYSTKYNDMLDHLSKLIVLRDKHAKILSYNCHSDFKSHTQMTKNSENIKNFLAELLHKLDFRYKRELDTLFKIMSKNDNNSSQINSWDVQYYITKWKQEYGVNENNLKEYFEVNNTISEILSIYEKMFSVKFTKSNIKGLWYDQIDTYTIMNAKNEIVGYLHMDLYSRNGKYKQTRCYCLQPATLKQLPIISLVASFQQNLLNFQEVISLFHEIGHVMHHVMGKTKYSIFSGVNVATDFVETPAQLLDLLCWEKHIIKQISKHYKTGEKLQDALISKIIKLKNLDIGLYYKRHILIALFDQVIYSSDTFINTCENILKSNDANQLNLCMNSLYTELHNEIMISNDRNQKYKINLNDNVGLPIEWINSLYGSDSQYYSSIWSRVLSSDMYIEKLKGKQINSDIGLQLTNKILMYGGTKPAYDMICDYIERKPAIDGFISMHDLDTDMEYSFFLNTDQIKQQQLLSSQKPPHTQPLTNAHIIQSIHKEQEVQKKKPKYNHDDYIDSVSNKFSEINESSLNIDDFEHQTEDMNYLKDKFKNYKI